MRAVLILTATLIACGPQPHGDDDTSGPTADAAAPGAADASTDATSDGPPYHDFPADPVIVPGAPANAAGLFAAAGQPFGGPCLAEPADGALFPRHWLRVRFRLEPAAGHNLFEIRVHAASEANDLVVYTTSPTWAMPKEMWTALNQHVVDEDLQVTVRSAAFNGVSLESGPAAGATTTFRIAPVAASGSIVYWSSGQFVSESAFKGFMVGEETVHDVLTSAQAGVGCVGCHSSTPDGKFVAFSANVAAQDGRPAHGDLRTLDGSAAQPPWLTQQAKNLLGRSYQQQPVFSRPYYDAGNRLAVTMFETGGKTEVVWTDLETVSEAAGTGWGVLARSGDLGSAAGAAWSHDGATIAYVTANFVSSGMNLDQGGGDIYTVPFNDGAGGVATPLPGAAESNYSEHYPAWSADDKLVAFTRVGAFQSSYDNVASEVFVVPAAGGTPVRLAANDPVGCTSRVSPGAQNSWPKWSPEVGVDGARRFYFLTFSSRRGPGGLPQLYIAAIVTDETGQHDYPAIYLWNQPEDESNHTPAWDTFDIVVN